MPRVQLGLRGKGEESLSQSLQKQQCPHSQLPAVLVDILLSHICQVNTKSKRTEGQSLLFPTTHLTHLAGNQDR